MAGLERNPELRQLITESFARFMQVIIESRLSSLVLTAGDGSGSSSAHRHRGPLFNFVLGKFSPMTNKMEPWSGGVWEPMIIDILYLQHGRKGAVGQKLLNNVRKLVEQSSWKIALDPSSSETAILLERWTVEFVHCNVAMEKEPGFFAEKGIIDRYRRAAQNSKHKVIPLRFCDRFRGLGKDEHEAMCVDVAKNLSILLRSLYSTARLLPAHSLSRFLSTTGKCRSKLAYRVSTTTPPSPISVKKDMTLFCFPPSDCHCGHLSISVAYRRTVPREEQKVPSLPHHIIMDYVSEVGRCHLNQLPGEKIGHMHSLPSARCLASFKASNLDQPGTKERALKEGQSWAIIQTDENETFDFPFAINEEICNRKKAAKLLSVKSDVGAHGKDAQEDPSIGALLAMLRPVGPLRRTRENLFLSSEGKKTAADALKELQMYITFKDDLSKSVHSKQKGEPHKGCACKHSYSMS